MRTGRVGVAIAGVLIALLGLVAPPVSGAPADACADPARIFAVSATDGRLVELGVCRSDPAFSVAAPVDTRDWRGYLNLTAVLDGAATVLYAVTPDGRLLWHRQPEPGAAFGEPVRVAAAVDWSSFPTVFAPQPGYLHTAGYGQPLRT